MKNLVHLRRVLLLCVVCLSVTKNVWADNSSNVLKNNRLELSKTFEVIWDVDLSAQVDFMPGAKGFWLQGKYQNKEYSILVSRNTPESDVNEKNVKKFWKENLEFAKDIGTTFNDEDCKQIQPTLYKCSCTSQGKSKNFAAEEVFWSKDKDLVLVRVMSPFSLEHARKILSKININTK